MKSIYDTYKTRDKHSPDPHITHSGDRSPHNDNPQILYKTPFNNVKNHRKTRNNTIPPILKQ